MLLRHIWRRGWKGQEDKFSHFLQKLVRSGEEPQIQHKLTYKDSSSDSLSINTANSHDIVDVIFLWSPVLIEIPLLIRAMCFITVHLSARHTMWHLCFIVCSYRVLRHYAELLHSDLSLFCCSLEPEQSSHVSLEPAVWRKDNKRDVPLWFRAKAPSLKMVFPLHTSNCVHVQWLHESPSTATN